MLFSATSCFFIFLKLPKKSGPCSCLEASFKKLPCRFFTAHFTKPLHAVLSIAGCREMNPWRCVFNSELRVYYIHISPGHSWWQARYILTTTVSPPRHLTWNLHIIHYILYYMHIYHEINEFIVTIAHCSENPDEGTRFMEIF